MVKRIVLLATVALVMAAMMVVAGPASATIHEIAKMECANQENASEVVQTQEPRGLTGQSKGKPPNNATGTNIAQPVFAVTPEGQPLFPGAPFEDTNPSANGASGHALKAEGC